MNTEFVASYLGASVMVVGGGLYPMGTGVDIVAVTSSLFGVLSLEHPYIYIFDQHRHIPKRFWNLTPHIKMIFNSPLVDYQLCKGKNI